MWFRNLLLYRLAKPFTLSDIELHEELEREAFRPCGSLELSTFGWENPLGRNGSRLTHAANGCLMICARKEEKVLPAAVVRETLEEKTAEIEESEERRVGRKERESLRHDIMHDLLPRAFTKSTLHYAYVDTKQDWILVDAATPKRAEELISLLRQTLGTLPVKPVAVDSAPAAVMTGWLGSQSLPGDFQLQDEGVLRDPSDEGATVRCRRQDLNGEEIKAHLDAGKQAIQLALEWGERLSFVLGEDLSIKRLKFLDIIQEEAAAVETEDEIERFDADFALMNLELRRFVGRLLELFGGEAVDS